MHTGTALAEPWAQPPGAQQLLAVPWGTEHTEHTAPCSQHCPEHPADRMHEVCRWISSNQSHCRGMHAIAGEIWEFQTLLGVSYGKLTAAQILVHAGVSATNCLPVSHKGSRQWIKFPRLLQVNTRSCSSGKHRVVHWPLHLLLFQSFTSVRTDPWRGAVLGSPGPADAPQGTACSCTTGEEFQLLCQLHASKSNHIFVLLPWSNTLRIHCIAYSTFYLISHTVRFVFPNWKSVQAIPQCVSLCVRIWDSVTRNCNNSNLNIHLLWMFCKWSIFKHCRANSN